MVVSIVAITGRRASGKTSLIQKIRRTSFVPFVFFTDHPHSMRDLNVWWANRSIRSEYACAVFDDLPISFWRQSILQNIVHMCRHKRITILIATERMRDLPIYIRQHIENVIVCPDQRNDNITYESLFATDQSPHAAEEVWRQTLPDTLSWDSNTESVQSVSSDFDVEETDTHDANEKALPSNLEDRVCAITMQTIEAGQLFCQCDKCNHVFDLEAMCTWRRRSKSCPMCRTQWKILKCYMMPDVIDLMNPLCIVRGDS